MSSCTIAPASPCSVTKEDLAIIRAKASRCRTKLRSGEARICFRSVPFGSSILPEELPRS